ncbi:tRNA (adenosine(37)-N6)-threonylcarbamoyltransferase complex transferase subunit TsaD [Fervidobacterium thailandense]|uniref:tRNA N6-adenosine threonylcarbamoyltransferase n=1 Tax=Fervidobacterium thailandense TaxID=1008305 RepID=A0A1E3G3E0_9BACT|nr:tRNA (adenosine(37)-N6)-threonylcarbamoyltransferase complex transferase subunit TsaD [Fervidobacterium thailandense]ODN30680.1 tRNA N6-adenosine(37)-threonylcarbamoyltransferase complex transferase subunit TsaD [Fervidobacterium thailandense]
MLVLGIETSCDETSVALVEDNAIVENLVYSQIETHRVFGGVVPEIAAREHLKRLPILFLELIQKTNVKLEDVDGIAVTKGPGLIGALLVGVSFAKGLALRYGKPLVGVNHIEGHIFANYLAYPELKPPFIVLMVSGGHTLILKVETTEEFTIIGRSVDDAVGEAFDKIARLLGLGYPGGPEIDKVAKLGNPQAFQFPRPKFHDDDYDFSFSGLKTAVLYEIQRLRKGRLSDTDKLPQEIVADLAASAQEAMIDVLVHKVTKAARDHGIEKIVIAGGVAANSRLRERLKETAGFEFFLPPLELCSDNAAMIARVGVELLKKGHSDDLKLEPEPNFFEMLKSGTSKIS